MNGLYNDGKKKKAGEFILNDILRKLTEDYPDLHTCIEDIEKAFIMLKESFMNGGKYLICGNGGSAADSDHIVGELMKGFKQKRPINDFLRQRLIKEFNESGKFLADHLQGTIPAISLVNHHALISAFSNDVSADLVFAQQVLGYGKEGDVLIGISTSGNSKNVIYALMIARVLGIRTIGLTGKNGGKMRDLCDVLICVPYEETPKIQERHLPIYHALCSALEKELFSE